MFRNFLISTGLLVYCLLLLSCKISIPSVDNIRGVKFVQTPTGNAGLEAEIQIKNPNKFGFIFKKPQVSIELNNKPLVEVKGAKKIHVKKSSEDFYKITFYAQTSSMQMVLSDLPALLMGTANIRIHGTAKAGVFIFCKKFSFDQSERINISSGLIPSKNQ